MIPRKKGSGFWVQSSETGWLRTIERHLQVQDPGDEGSESGRGFCLCAQFFALQRRHRYLPAAQRKAHLQNMPQGLGALSSSSPGSQGAA